MAKTAEQQQIADIVALLNPENPNQTDALFLVTRMLSQLNASLAAKNQQIALLEAQLEERSQEKHLVINEKLESESRLKEEKDDIIKKRNKDSK